MASFASQCDVPLSLAARAQALDTVASLHPGEAVALVGPSGAGKSTVFQLLLRFFDPQEAHPVDGVNIADLDPRELNDKSRLWHRTPRSFGHHLRQHPLWPPEASEAEVYRAAEAAAADEFHPRLPMAYGARLGERGVTAVGRAASTRGDCARNSPQRAVVVAR